MMNIIFSISLCSLSMFIFMNHPISMGSMLLIQTITTSLITGCLNNNFWYSYILTLIMIGGMLILFMYMTSIASNEKFKPSTKMTIFFISSLTCSFLTTNYFEILKTNNETMEFILNWNNFSSLNKFITMPLTLVLLMMMIYLLIAMIASVKITNFKKGSIRQMK